MSVKKMRTGAYRVDFRDAEGNRYRKLYPTKHEADAAYEEARRRVRTGEFVAPKKVPTFAEVGAAWLLARSDRRGAVLDNYTRYLNQHFVPRLGNVRLDCIDAQMIESLRAALRQTLAVSTVRSMMAVLSTILKFAVRHNHLRINPMVNVERMHARATELFDDHDGERDTGQAARPEDVLNTDEIRRLIAAARPGLYRTFIATAAATGARWGELAALPWNNIDLDGRVIHIRRSLSWAKGTEEQTRARFYEPKTQSGVRSIPIPHELAIMLKAWKLACPPGELAFPAMGGKPLHRSQMYKLGLVPALKSAGLRHVKFHSLRHSFASALIQHGAPVTEVQHLLGHSNPSITLRVYSHWFRGAESGATTRVASELFGLQLGHSMDTRTPSGMKSA